MKTTWKISEFKNITNKFERSSIAFENFKSAFSQNSIFSPYVDEILETIEIIYLQFKGDVS